MSRAVPPLTGENLYIQGGGGREDSEPSTVAYVTWNQLFVARSDPRF